MRFILAFLLPILAWAAPTVTSRGTGGNNTGATTYAVVPTSTIAAGSMGVLVIALDNAGSGGNTAAAPATQADSVGNTWTRRLSAFRDPAGASGGVELAIYTCDKLTTQLTSSNNITLTWVAGVSPVAKSFALYEVTPDALNQINYKTAGGGDSDNTTTPTVTTGTVTSGDIVIGGGGAEGTLDWTGDADTTNGSWANEQEIGNGTGTSGMAVTAQSKITTGTATQTYNPTLGSGVDRIVGYISVRQELTPTASPSAFFQLF